jgi:hypothetical protein
VMQVRGSGGTRAPLSGRRSVPFQGSAFADWRCRAARVARRNTTREGGGAAPEGLRGWDTVSGEVSSLGALGWLGERTSS